MDEVHVTAKLRLSLTQNDILTADHILVYNTPWQC